MVIDAHVHLTSIPYNGVGLLKDLLPSFRRRVIEGALAIGELKWSGFDLSAKEMLVKAVKEPRIRVAAEVDMERPVRAEIARLDRLRKDRRVAAVKLYPGYQPRGPSSPKLDPLFSYCARHEVPVIVHTGDTLELPGTPRPRIRFAHPLALDDVAVRHPTLRLIIAHLGNPWVADAAEVIYKNKNVYGDVSGFLTDFNDARCTALAAARINEVVAYCGAKKLLFGTDWPIVDIAAYLRFIRRAVRLREAERALFFGGNAKALYGF